MMRTARKENSKPINVTLCGVEPLIFEQYQQALHGIGYHLTIIAKQAKKPKILSDSEVYITAALFSKERNESYCGE